MKNLWKSLCVVVLMSVTSIGAVYAFDGLAAATGRVNYKMETANDLSKAVDILNDKKQTGDSLNLKQLLELGILPTPDVVDKLNDNGIDLSLIASCPMFKDISGPMYEWSQFETKSGSAKLEKNGLEIKSKDDAIAAVSIVDLELDPSHTPFEFGMSFINTSTDDGKLVGLVFDYINNKQYKAIVFGKKEFQYYTVEKGEASIVKQGLVKAGKYINSIIMISEVSKIEILLNGQEVTTLKRMSLTSPMCGVIVTGKRNATCDAFYFNILESEAASEQSTSDV